MSQVYLSLTKGLASPQLERGIGRFFTGIDPWLEGIDAYSGRFEALGQGAYSKLPGVIVAPAIEASTCADPAAERITGKEAHPLLFAKLRRKGRRGEIGADAKLAIESRAPAPSGRIAGNRAVVAPSCPDRGPWHALVGEHLLGHNHIAHTPFDRKPQSLFGTIAPAKKTAGGRRPKKPTGVPSTRGHR